MKILITGASGFVGGSIVEYLVKEYNFNEPLMIKCLVRKTSNLERVLAVISEIERKSINNIEVKFSYGDITEPQSLVEAVKEVDVVLHCAALLRTNNVEDYYRVNHIGTKNLLEAVLLHNSKLKYFILVSSQAVSGPCCGNRPRLENEKSAPVSHYGKSKLLAEDEVMVYSKKFEGFGCKSIILRPGPVYGPYDKDMFLYFKYAQKGFLPVFSKEFVVQFTFIKDLSRVCKEIILSSSKIPSGVYFVAEERCYNITEISKIFSEVVSKNVKVVKLPYFFAYVYAYINEIVHKIFLHRAAVFNRDKLDELKCSYWLCRSSTIKNFLNIEYTPLKVAAIETYTWYKEKGWL